MTSKHRDHEFAVSDRWLVQTESTYADALHLFQILFFFFFLQGKIIREVCTYVKGGRVNFFFVLLFAGGERPCHFFEKNKNFFLKYQIRNVESPLLNPAPSVWRLMSRFFILFKIIF